MRLVYCELLGHPVPFGYVAALKCKLFRFEKSFFLPEML